MTLEEEKEILEKLWENILIDAIKKEFDKKHICHVMKELNEIDKQLFKIGTKK